jgi:transposase
VLPSATSASIGPMRSTAGRTPVSESLVSEPSFQYFIGIDWSHTDHEVCILESDGRRRQRLSVAHTPAGVGRLLSALRELGDAASLAVAIETPNHPLVDALLLQGIAVFALNPKQADRFRDRHSAAGSKDDRKDAYVLADALRTDLLKFSAIALPAPLLLALRETSRRHDALTEDLNRLSNRLWIVLQSFAPQLLTLCPGANEPFFWVLLDLAADPAKARALRPARVQRVLHAHHKRKFTPEQLLAVLRSSRFVLVPGAQDAILKSITALLPLLQATFKQLSDARAELTRLVHESGSDAAIIDSFPGVDVLVTATLLAEAAPSIAARNLKTLRTHAGTAPVCRRSGASHSVTMRRACNTRLRDACFAWSRTAIRCDPWASSLFRAMRARGLRYHRALRGIADRLLSRLIACLKTDALFDPNAHSSPTLVPAAS